MSEEAGVPWEDHGDNEPVARLPTVDDEEPPPRVDYRDWSAENTKVVSGPVGPAKHPGRRFRSRREAKAYWTGRAGRVLADLSVPGRWVFRVRRDA